MSTFLRFVFRYSKSIILCCILAVCIAQLAIHRFDPFHPRSITSECIQTTVTPVSKNGWLAIAAALAAYLLYKKHVSYEDAVRLSIKFAVVSEVTLLLDPIRLALRLGRLRRLVYS